MNRYKINDNDQAVGRAFPNAKSSVLLVPGVTNKNLFFFKLIKCIHDKILEKKQIHAKINTRLNSSPSLF